MVNISLKLVPIETPDAEQRVKSAWRILAEMVLVEVERDGKLAPKEHPQETSGQSQTQHTALIHE